MECTPVDIIHLPQKINDPIHNEPGALHNELGAFHNELDTFRNELGTFRNGSGALRRDLSVELTNVRTDIAEFAGVTRMKCNKS